MKYPRYKKLIPSSVVICKQYKEKLGIYPNLINPKLYNEKLQWLKLHDKNPNYSKLVDKYSVKKYVGDIIGSEYIIPTLGVWDNINDIDFSKLPNKFVLKTTHDSGSVIICRDKETFNQKQALEKLEKCLELDYYWLAREWPYKNVVPRIIAEPLLEDDGSEHIPFEESIYAIGPSAKELQEKNALPFYMYCYNGKVKAFGYLKDGKSSGLISKQGESITATGETISFTTAIKDDINKMIGAAEKLAEAHQMMKVSFYYKEHKVYFGEISIPHELLTYNDDYKEHLLRWLDINKNTREFDPTQLFPFMEEEKDIVESITDYKFFCFDGIVDNVMIVEDRQSGVAKFFHFSRDWELLKYNRMGRLLPDNAMIKRPKLMDEMIEIAETLSKGLPEVRLDLYVVNNKIYFGEYTFFHHGGYEDGFDLATNMHMGDLIVLPKRGK